MDYNEPSKTSSINIDIDGEEIELDSEEHDLFLKDEYRRPNGDNFTSFRATDPAQQLIVNIGGHQNTRSRTTCSREDEDPEANVENLHSNLIGSTSNLYQTPSYQQFADSLAPSSPLSVVISVIIVIVILCVTVLPIILSKSESSLDGESRNETRDKNSNQTPRVEHSDARCKCICPPFTETPEMGPVDLTQKRLYVGNTLPSQCNCISVVLPHLNISQAFAREVCVKCQCKFQSRNTAAIRRNVIFFIAVLTGLALYMFIQYLLKFFRITRRSLPQHLRWLSFQSTENG